MSVAIWLTDRPLLIASNHISWTDIMVIGSLADVSFIARSDVAGWPFIGAISRLQRTVFVERNRKRSSGDQAGEIAGRLASNDALVLFAEGSTGDGNHLLPFKSTLFGAARLVLGEANVETVYIQPVAIAYTRLHGMPMGRQHRGLPPGSATMIWLPTCERFCARARWMWKWSFGEPLEFTEASDRKQISRRVEQRVRAMMADMLRHRQRATTDVTR